MQLAQGDFLQEHLIQPVLNLIRAANASELRQHNVTVPGAFGTYSPRESGASPGDLERMSLARIRWPYAKDALGDATVRLCLGGH
jgi:hypothetical protein